jgi:hypothetical protein
MSVPVKVLEHRAKLDAMALADLLVEFVAGGLVFGADAVRPVLASRLRRELSAAVVKRLAAALDEPRPWVEQAAVEPERASIPRFCPDGGTCHHECSVGPCFRTLCCGPLSGVFLGDVWPEEYR